MNWNQKLKAMRALDAECGPKMMPDCESWSFSCGELAGDGFLRGAVAWGSSPEAVVSEVWEKLIAQNSGELHVYARGRRVRWNGFMWEEFKANP
jgi:hypothetical protein